jgi:Tfp pilus assembly protein PilE
MHKRLSRGFTIVEIATVVFIIALLAVITVVAYNNVQRQARDTSKEQAVKIIMTSLERYYDAHGEYPTGNQLNPNKDLNKLTNLSATVQYLPNLTTDNLSTDAYNFYAYCDNTDCNGASWLQYRRYQIIYSSRWDASTTGTNVYVASTQASGGSGCKVTEYYDNPAYTLQWYNEDQGVWKFIRSKHGQAEVTNNGSAPTPPQTCTFTTI